MQVEDGLPFDAHRTLGVVADVERADDHGHAEDVEGLRYATPAFVHIDEDASTLRRHPESLPERAPTKWGSFVARAKQWSHAARPVATKQ
jgi:hypothetical protein